MSDLNATPSGERIHIGFFGQVNAGKSSLINAFTGQSLSLVSDREGTTTDPVKKAMELLPLGPVVVTDTPGIGDGTALGKLRMEQTKKVIGSIQVAVLVVGAKKDKEVELSAEELNLLETFKSEDIPCIIAINKSDLLQRKAQEEKSDFETTKHNHQTIIPDFENENINIKTSKPNNIFVSALTGENIDRLKELVAEVGLTVAGRIKRFLISDLLKPGDHVVLVIPIDESAPKGRLILPQQMVMRDILDAGCSFSVAQPGQLSFLLESLDKVSLVVTDSQVFEQVGRIVPRSTPLTSFSILMARYRGELQRLMEGAEILKDVKSSDRILISEACTHHRQCNDIGSVKLPGWVREYTGAEPAFEFTSGGEFPEDLSAYRLILHCGGCMINEKQMHSRMERAHSQGVPVLNYGMAIACMHGILERSLEIFD